MFYSYFLAALRNLLKHPLNSIINVLGLSLGLACCIMLLVFISNQLSYDTQFTDHQRIYVLEREVHHDLYPFKNKVVSRKMVEVLHANLPDIEEIAILDHFPIRYINDAGEPSNKRLHYTKSNFFQIFDFPFVEGTPNDALQQANDAVLTQSEAKKYFGNQPAFGKTFAIGDVLFRVSGVIADLPQETHFKDDSLDPRIIAASRTVSWDLEHRDKMAIVHCYIKLSPGADRDWLNRRINELVSLDKDVFGPDSPAYSSGDVKVSLTLRPIRNSHLGDSIKSTGKGERLFQSWPFIYAAAGLALAVLLISCINFINLATARFSLRNLEIGLRKTLGAERRQIFSQFICETLALTILAVIVALVIAYLGLPWFSSMIQIDLTQVGYATPLFFYCLAGLIVLTTLFAGFYPSLVLSRVNPIFALGSNDQKIAKSRLRTVLTTLQFVFSIFLITVCIVAYYQITHLKTMDLGYDQEDIAYFHTPFYRQQQALRNELARELEYHSAVESTSITLRNASYRNIEYRIQGSGSPPAALASLATGKGFLEHYQIKLMAGRAFQYSAVSEQSKVAQRDRVDQRGRFEQMGTIMLTLSGLEALGIPSAEEAVGKILEVPDGDSAAGLEIIGVVDAFPGMLEQQQGSSIIVPDFLYYDEAHPDSVISVRFREGRRSEGLEYLKQVAKQDKDIRTFLSFPNQKLEILFQALDRILSSVALFAIIAVMVAVMGLYAMSAFVVARRTQEIGVRKVMGAPLVRVILLLLWDFSKPILVAMAMALPLAYLGASQVIQHVAARIPLEVIVFGAVPLLIILVALVSVSGHTVKAASINPVRALRYE